MSDIEVMNMNPPRKIEEGLETIIHDPNRFGLLSLLHIRNTLTFKSLRRALELKREEVELDINVLTQIGYLKIEHDFTELLNSTLIHITQQGRLALKEYIHNFKEIFRNAIEN